MNLLLKTIIVSDILDWCDTYEINTSTLIASHAYISVSLTLSLKTRKHYYQCLSPETVYGVDQKE